MSQERIPMKKVKEILRLHFHSQLSHRQIGRALKMAPSTVSHYVNAAKAAGLDWSQCQPMEPAALLKTIETHCQQLTTSTSNFRQARFWASNFIVRLNFIHKF